MHLFAIGGTQCPARVSETQRENEWACFALGIDVPIKDIHSSPESDFHSNSMHLLCLSGT